MWTVTLDFLAIVDGDSWEDAGDTVVSRSFLDEDEARAFWADAKEACQDWVEDEDGVRPGDKALEFVRKHECVVYDPEGVLWGGFHNGQLLPGTTIAPSTVVSAVYQRDVQAEWGALDAGRDRRV